MYTILLIYVASKDYKADFMRAEKFDYRVVSLPAIWQESFKETNSFIDKLAMVKSRLIKWVQYNTELQIINNSFVNMTGSAGILLMDVHTEQWDS